MRRAHCIGLLVLLAAMPSPSHGQSSTPDPNAPPRVLVIFREEVKPGKAAAHSAIEVGWPAAFAKAQWPVHYLAATTMTGPSEAWFLTGYPSFEAWEQDTKALEANQAMSAELDKLSARDGELLNRWSSIVATYVPTLSYQPLGVPGLVDKRYMSIEMFRVKPGRGAEFNEQWREIIAAHEKAKMDEHWATYAVQSGMPSGTLLFIYARKSLKDLDDANTMHGAAAYRDATGERGRARNREMSQIAVDFSQTILFAFSPKMSYVPKAFSDADPAYWGTQPAPASAATSKKPGQ